MSNGNDESRCPRSAGISNDSTIPRGQSSDEQFQTEVRASRQKSERTPFSTGGARFRRRFQLAARTTVIVIMVSLSYFVSPLISNLQSHHSPRSWIYAFLLSSAVALLTLMAARLQGARRAQVHKRAHFRFSRTQFQFALLVLVLYAAACLYSRPNFAQARYHFVLTLASSLALTVLSLITWLRPLLNQIQDFPQIDEPARAEASGVLLIALGLVLTSSSVPSWYIEFTLFIVGVTLCWTGAFIFTLSAISIIRLLRAHCVASILDRILDLPVLRRFVTDGLLKFRILGKLNENSYRVGVSFITVAVLAAALSTVALGATSLGSNGVYHAPTHQSGPTEPTLPLQRIERTPLGMSFIADCGSTTADLPGSGLAHRAPWASRLLFDQWLEPGVGVGATIAGCPTAVVEVRDSGGVVFYQAGYQNGFLQSVAIASRRYGGCILLDGGAASFALSLLQKGAAISCSQRQVIGNGEYQLLYDNEGTWLLCRPTDHPTGQSQRSTPFVVVPPAAAVLWYTESIRAGRFLWPYVVQGTTTDPRVLSLNLMPYSKGVATLQQSASGSFNVATGFDVGAQSFSGIQISSYAINQLAKKTMHY